MRYPLLMFVYLVTFVTSAFAADGTGSADALKDVKSRLSHGKPTRIVCFGDSITGVYYHSGSQRAWCDMLGLALNKAYPNADVQMINAGISGHTTVQALARIEKDVLDRKPHLVVVKFGMNDVARGPVDRFKANMVSIVKQCREAGSSVVLCTPNSVYENTARPNAKLAEFSKAVRQTASDFKLPLVDLFRDWQQLRKKDEMAWSLLMSDAIHPNMNGHRRIAELVAQRVSGKTADEVSLADVQPPQDTLHHTFTRLSQKQPVRIVAMSPYDRDFPEALRKHFPDAKFEVTTWPFDKDVNASAEWAKRIRGLKPHLVIVAVPVTARAKGLDQYIRSYEWVLNWSFNFAGRPWDVLPILPSTKDGASTENEEYQLIAREIVRGKDVTFFREGSEVLSVWIGKTKTEWETRSKE